MRVQMSFILRGAVFDKFADMALVKYRLTTSQYTTDMEAPQILANMYKQNITNKAMRTYNQATCKGNGQIILPPNVISDFPEWEITLFADRFAAACLIQSSILSLLVDETQQM